MQGKKDSTNETLEFLGPTRPPLGDSLSQTPALVTTSDTLVKIFLHMSKNRNFLGLNNTLKILFHRKDMLLHHSNEVELELERGLLILFPIFTLPYPIHKLNYLN